MLSKISSRIYSAGQGTDKKVKRGIVNYSSKLKKQGTRLVQTAKAVGVKAKESAVLAGKVSYSFGSGVYDAGKSAVDGVIQMVSSPAQTAKGIGNALIHPIDTGEAIYTQVSDSFVQDVVNGNAESSAHWFGRAIGEVALAIVGTKGVDKLADVAKGSRLVTEVSEAAKASRAAQMLGRAGNRIRSTAVRLATEETGSFDPFFRLGREGTGEASNAFKYDLLKKDLKYTEKYGLEARKELPDGRIRYYGEVQPASKPGEMVGRRVVQELNPANGNVRAWNETLDGAGRIRQVRPQLGPDKTHYTFDQSGNYTGKW